ncbi:hypothetical protein [Flavobacterium sp. UMI-01]|uniref:hypothetical protein n=1 Tax=Flavobacterium sp. UMI-01 TaxID=1441053 RepID=UPI001C7CAF43|nr:hypothetical protein [Flavobacterium sp. UMI-01]GIZ09977.1 hypothetical protein FUMI01_27030 [Flavobacterium sp. UMI-01]
MAGKGILLDENNDLLITGGQMVVGDSIMQEVAIIIEMPQAALKSNPLLGADLIKLLKANTSKVDIERTIRIQLEKDRKDYSTIKNKIKTTIK